MTSIQKVIKYLAIAFAVVLIVAIFSGIIGIIAAISGIASWSNDRATATVQTDTVYSGTISSDIHHLDMQIGAANVVIETGEFLSVETDNPYITVTEQDEKLLIREKSHIANLDSSTVTVCIPEDLVFDEVDITTGAGLINLETLTCRELDMELGAGKVEMDNLNVTGDADIDGGAGQIIIHSGNLNNLSFDMGVGEGDVVTVLTGQCDISAGIGALYLTIPGKLEDYTIHTEQGIGRIEVDNMAMKGHGTIGSGANRLEIEGGIGNITVDFED